MPDAADRPGRLLAPLALVVCAIAFFAVLLGSDASDDSGSGAAAPAAPVTNTQDSGAQRSRPLRRNYTVQPNDSLDGIAQRFGLEVERLQELNPEVDPQGLVVGQKIKLRE